MCSSDHPSISYQSSAARSLKENNKKQEKGKKIQSLTKTGMTHIQDGIFCWNFCISKSWINSRHPSRRPSVKMESLYLGLGMKTFLWKKIILPHLIRNWTQSSKAIHQANNRMLSMGTAIYIPHQNTGHNRISEKI